MLIHEEGNSNVEKDLQLREIHCDNLEDFSNIMESIICYQNVLKDFNFRVS